MTSPRFGCRRVQLPAGADDRRPGLVLRAGQPRHDVVDGRAAVVGPGRDEAAAGEAGEAALILGVGVPASRLISKSPLILWPLRSNSWARCATLVAPTSRRIGEPAHREAAVGQGWPRSNFIAAAVRSDDDLAGDLGAVGGEDLRLDDDGGRDVGGIGRATRPPRAEGDDGGIRLAAEGDGVDKDLAAEPCAGGVENLRLDRVAAAVAAKIGIGPGCDEAATAEAGDSDIHLVAIGRRIDLLLSPPSTFAPAALNSSIRIAWPLPSPAAPDTIHRLTTKPPSATLAMSAH